MADDLKKGYVNYRELWAMSAPDLWVAAQPIPIPQLMSMGEWERFFQSSWSKRIKAFVTLWRQSPWPRPESGLLIKEEATFWCWFALHEKDMRVRRVLFAFGLFHSGCRIEGNQAILTPGAETGFQLLELVRRDCLKQSKGKGSEKRTPK